MEYTITRYKMTEENIEGGAKAEKKDYDLLDVVMVCLGQKKKGNGVISWHHRN